MTERPTAFQPVPAVFDLVTAARMLGIGRTVAYQLVRQGKWPTPVLRLGSQIKVPSAPLYELLGLSTDPRLPLTAKRPAGDAEPTTRS
jgi:hypothetical protein